MGKYPHYSSSLVSVFMTKSENQNEARAVLGGYPKIFPYCIGPIQDGRDAKQHISITHKIGFMHLIFS